MDKTAYCERIKEIEKHQPPYDVFAGLDDEDIPKKKRYTLRMEVTFNRKLTQEEAEKVIHNALHSAGVIGHMGGIS